MREKHLAVYNFGIKISDDDQKNIFRAQRRGDAKIILEHENTFYSNTENTEQTEFSFLSCFFVFNKIINVVLMQYYTFSLREENINYHKCHINLALIFSFRRSENINV